MKRLNLPASLIMPMLNSMRYYILLFFLTTAIVGAQDTEVPTVDGRYRAFYLSMSEEQCRQALLEDGYFLYDGYSSPSLMEESEEVLIDCEGRSYISRGWFQFNDDRLVLMTLQLNPEKIDYYTMFSYLQEKYGTPGDLNPQQALWRNDETGHEVLLLKPLEIKFRDGDFLQGLIDDSRAQESYDELLRQRFMEDF